MKFVKLTVFAFDANEDHETAEEIIDTLEREIERRDYITIKTYLEAETDIEWHDEININQIGCKKYHYERYFGQSCCNEPNLINTTDVQTRSEGYESFICNNCNVRIKMKV